jgi:DNA-directed RNA polymerase specialized sigma24 family protein
MPHSEDHEGELEPRHRCLKLCLEELPEEDRELILEFYDSKNETDRTARRKAMADKMGMSSNSLRIYTHRHMQRLRSCIQECLHKYD